MRKFAILRSISPSTTRDQVDVAALQNIFNLSAIGVGPDDAFDARLSSECELAWIRSYWHEGSDWGLCLYTARSEQDLELYHTACDIAYAAFDPVRELRSGTHASPGTGHTLMAPGFRAFAVEVVVPGAASLTNSDFEDFSKIAAMAGAPVPAEIAACVQWVRSYVHDRGGRVLATYAAPAENVAELLEMLRMPGIAARPITEIIPEEYGAEAPPTAPDS